MTVAEFLDILENNQLVEPRLVSDFRKQVAKVQRVVDPKEIARLLVAHGDLTAKQAFRVLSSRPKTPPAGGSPPVASVSPIATPPAQPSAFRSSLAPLTPTAPSDADEPQADDEAPLVPLPILRPRPSIPLAPTDPGTDEELTLAPIEPDTPGRLPAPRAPHAPAPPTRVVTQPPALPTRSRTSAIQIELSTFDDLLNEAGIGAFDPTSLSAGGVALVHHGRRVRARRWIKPIAAAMAALTVMVLGFAYLLHHRATDSAARLAAAEHDFLERRYAHGAEKYGEFIHEYPTHPEASQARVRRALCQVLAASTNQSDWSAALPVIAGAIEGVVNEPLYAESRSTIAPALIQLAGSLVELAGATRNAEQVKRIAEARRAVELVADSRHLPVEARPWQLLERWSESLQIAELDSRRQSSLAAAIADARARAAAGDIDAFDKVTDKLMREFPDLRADEQLGAVAKTLSESELKLAKAGNAEFRRISSDQSNVAATAILVDEDTTDAPTGPLLLANVAGYATAIDDRGHSRWRRFIGGQPPPITDTTGAAAVMIAANGAGLTCVEARSGEWRWGVECSETMLDLAADGDAIIVTTRGGTIAALAAQSGECKKQLRLPRSISAVSAVRDHFLYAIGARNTMCVLRCDTLECVRSVYLGHEEGGISLSPVISERVLLIGENRGFAQARLRQFDIEAGIPSRELSPLSIDGQLVRLVAQSDGAVAAEAADGRWFTRQADSANRSDAWDEWSIGEFTSDGRVGASDAHSSEGTWWFAGEGLRGAKSSDRPLETVTEVRAANVNFLGQLHGNWLYLMDSGVPDNKTIVSFRPTDRQLLWRRPFTATRSLALDVERDGTIVARTIYGLEYRWSIGDASPNQNLKPAGDLPSADAASAINDPGSVFWLSAAPATVKTSESGQIDWLDLETGRPRASLAPYVSLYGKALPKPTPAVDGRSLIVSDGGGRVCRVAAEQDGSLKIIAEGTLAGTNVVELTAANNQVFALTDDGKVHVLDETSLMPAGELSLPDEQRVTQVVAISAHEVTEPILFTFTDRDRLIAWNSSARVVWQQSCVAGKLLGAARIDEGRIAVAHSNGLISVVRPADGERLTSLDLAEPLIAGPAIANGAIVVATRDGRLLKVLP